MGPIKLLANGVESVRGGHKIYKVHGAKKCKCVFCMGGLYFPTKLRGALKRLKKPLFCSKWTLRVRLSFSKMEREPMESVRGGHKMYKVHGAKKWKLTFVFWMGGLYFPTELRGALKRFK